MAIHRPLLIKLSGSIRFVARYHYYYYNATDHYSPPATFNAKANRNLDSVRFLQIWMRRLLRSFRSTTVAILLLLGVRPRGKVQHCFGRRERSVVRPSSGGGIRTR